MIDIKAIKAAAEAAESRNWTHGANPATVIALCDEIERLATIASELQDLCDRQAKRLERAVGGDLLPQQAEQQTLV